MAERLKQGNNFRCQIYPVYLPNLMLVIIYRKERHERVKVCRTVNLIVFYSKWHVLPFKYFRFVSEFEGDRGI